jgi:hypothetical protein
MSTSLSVNIPAQDIGNAFKYFWNLLGLSTRVTGLYEYIEDAGVYIKCIVTTYESSENLNIIQKSMDICGYADVYSVNHTPTDFWRLWPQKSVYVKVPVESTSLNEHEIMTESKEKEKDKDKEIPKVESFKFSREPQLDTLKPFVFTKELIQPIHSLKPFTFAPISKEPITRMDKMTKECILWLNQETSFY